jgi:hypothetical protein
VTEELKSQIQLVLFRVRVYEAIEGQRMRELFGIEELVLSPTIFTPLLRLASRQLTMVHGASLFYFVFSCL